MENPHNTNQEGDPVEGLGTTRLAKEAAALSEVLKKKSTEESGIEKPLALKIARRAKKSIRNLLCGMAVLSVAIQVNHLQTRYEITETNQKNEHEYQHEDQQTTLILNYLLGREKLPEDQKLIVYRQVVRDAYQIFLYPEPKNLSSLDEERLRELLTSLYSEMGFGDDSEQEARDDFERATAERKYDAKVYNLIWQMHKEVGAPKLRWASEGTDIVARLMSEMTTEGRPFYDPVSNTIYVDPHMPAFTLLGEEMHAKQFNENPQVSYARFALSWVRTLGRTLTQFNDVRTSYGAEYEIKGTLEHEAHKKMEAEYLEDLKKRHESDK